MPSYYGKFEEDVKISANLRAICDISGAAYALFWVLSQDQLSIASHFVTPKGAAVKDEDGASFATKSRGIALRVGQGLAGRAFASKGAEFVPDACALSAASFPRLSLAKEFGIRSMGFVFRDGGVYEYGTDQVWESLPEVSTALDLTTVLKTACEASGACYTMFWAESGGKLSVISHYNTPERLAEIEAKHGSSKQTFASLSRATTLSVGQGLIGRVFASKGEEFVPDTSALTADRFPRLQHAKEFGIKSIGAYFCDGGVLEFGTTEQWSCPHQLRAAINVTLKLKAACDKTGAGYALFWAEHKGKLSPVAHYNTMARYTSCKARRGDEETFATKSKSVSIAVGEGLVGRAFAQEVEQFVPDACALTFDGFPRLHLAREFGIRSIGAVPYDGGVLEFGTDELWTSMPGVKAALDRETKLRAACEASGAVYALFWTESAGKLCVAARYNTPVRVWACQASRRDGETFVTRSQKTPLPVGKGLIGRVFASKGEEFVPDTSALTADRFPRLQHAKEFGIKSIGAYFCDGGVLEFGTTTKWNHIPKVKATIELPSVCQTSGAVYALFWEESGGKLTVSTKYVTPGRALMLKASRGDNESFIAKSSTVSLRSGEGVVGRVFASKGEELVPDVSELQTSQFARAALAKEFGIAGLAAVFWNGGVLEYGSTERWSSRPKVRIDMVARLKAVCETSGAVYAMFWEEVAGTLTVLEHYHPVARLTSLRARRGDSETFATKSRRFSLVVGEGLVGRVFATGGKELVPDATLLSIERFPRTQHAKEFGIRSIVCIAVGGGVLEFGAVNSWSTMPSFSFSSL